MKLSYSKKAFTLIELLIVVAIIAILAAIAVPNFLEAQTRAKVSRAKADMRTLATAIESYAVDYNKPPREYSTGVYGDPLIVPPGGGGAQGAGGIIFPGAAGQPGLSTPVAYITNAWINDPFVKAGDSIAEDEKLFSYKSMEAAAGIAENGGDILFFNRQGLSPVLEAQAGLSQFGSWTMISNGPDRSYFNTQSGNRDQSFNGCEYVIYDSSNGTVSFGNIMRTQKFSDSQMATDTNVLGPH